MEYWLKQMRHKLPLWRWCLAVIHMKILNAYYWVVDAPVWYDEETEQWVGYRTGKLVKPE